MTQDKEIIRKLFAIAEKQQRILTKIAQQLPIPTELKPAATVKKEADVILNALAPNVKSAISVLEVAPGRDSNTVKVRFFPQKNSPQVFAALQRTIEDLQNKNLLQGASYNIVEVP